MANLQRIEADDRVVIRWGDEGKHHAFVPGDDAAMAKAYRAAVAEGLMAGDAAEMDETARSVAREMQTPLGIRKEAGGGLCIGWWLPVDLAMDVARLAPSSEARDLHLTILHLASAEEMAAQPWDIDLVAAVIKLFSVRWGPIEGCVSGVGRFVGEEDEDILIALVDIPELGKMRHALHEDLCYQSAIPHEGMKEMDEHGFVPHITLSYVPKSAPSPPSFGQPIELTVESIAVQAAGQRAVFPLGGAPGGLTPDTAAETPVYRSQGAGKGDLEYAVTKAREEDRYTLGPLYAPDRQDAHGEFTDADTLQKAVWDYVRMSAAEGHGINSQHHDSGESTAGEWVEIMAWPYEHTIKVQTVAGKERELTMPAGTVYMGAVWDEKVWPLVKSGKLAGWSLGGRAVKVASKITLDSLQHMGDKTA